MTSTAPDAPSTADREIVTTRLLDAPRELVWKAWTDPRHVGRWWGPRGFTTTTHEIDVRPGGTWRFTMHGPDGTDFPNRIEFLEVVEPARLVYRHAGEGETEEVRFRTTVHLEPEGDRTRLTMRAVFDNAEVLRRVVEEYDAAEGAVQTVDRLAEHLATM